MLKTLAVFRDVFAHKETHPLADPRELRRVLSEISPDPCFKSLDEIVGWLESLQGAGEMSGELLFEITSLLDEAAQTHLKRVSRDYLNTPRHARAEEKRLWAISCHYYQLLADAYEGCLQAAVQKNKASDLLKPSLALIAARLIAALAAGVKWQQLHYGPLPDAVWQRLGSVLSVAEANGVADKPLALYPYTSGMTTPQQEFVKVVAFQAASMASLLPMQIEIAERLIGHFLPGFVFSRRMEMDSVYWLDLALPQPPLRLAMRPKESSPGLRFFKPATAHAAISALLQHVEGGGEVSKEINLGASYSARQLIPVLRHLAAYLAPIPPQRATARHRVKHRMSMIHGLSNIFAVFAPEQATASVPTHSESWVVENVSQGGLGAQLNALPVEWLKVGALLAMQPEGGKNWLLGIVRRYHRESECDVHVGIQTLAQHATPVDLQPRAFAGYGAATGLHGLLMQGAAGEEVQLLLPPASFDLRESLEFTQDGRRQLLSPVAMVEQTADYEVARYRLQAQA